jgi:hypothetical protein
MPLLFYGRLHHDEKRRLYSKDLAPIETSVFDNYKVKSLAPYHKRSDLANLWHFVDRNHTAVSWNECRLDITQHRGIIANETTDFMEQTIFMPQLVDQMQALEIIRTEFPDYLVPGAIVFRFNNQDGAYLYDD